LGTSKIVPFRAVPSHLMRRTTAGRKSNYVDFGFVFASDWWLLLAGPEAIMAIILITGGARSGKSLRAEVRACAFPQRPVYVATAEALDREMAERIATHRARRGDGWIEREVPLDLVPALIETDGGGARLIDCLTLWLSNLLSAERDWSREVARLTDSLSRQQSPVVMVTNEVGLGIVPDNALARAYRDAAGYMNQAIAGVADEVEFVVAGLPLKLK
jgi:adenosylcobinamide kinase/adenosylcobinamide-phosphate guanylyltransferase